jgi:hypothetical protein
VLGEGAGEAADVAGGGVGGHRQSDVCGIFATNALESAAWREILRSERKSKANVMPNVHIAALASLMSSPPGFSSSGWGAAQWPADGAKPLIPFA